MIDISSAIELLKKYSPESKPKYVFDMSDELYLIFAPESESEDSAETPFFTVNKNTEKVSYFNPTMDIDAFNNAVEKGPIKEF